MRGNRANRALFNWIDFSSAPIFNVGDVKLRGPSFALLAPSFVIITWWP